MPLHRQVFFIGGFDPKTPRHYHRIYRAAAAQRPASSAGESVKVGSRETESEWLDSWTVRWQEASGLTETRYTVMRWDDIVRQHWQRHMLRALRDYWNVYVRAGSEGMLRKVWRAAPTAFWLAMFPLGICLASLAVSAALVGGPLMAWGQLEAWQALLAALVFWPILWRQVEHRVDSEWLLRLYGFTWAQSRHEIPELEARLDALATELIHAAKNSPARELLVVAHSTGAMLAASIVARALQRAPGLGHQGPQLALLTLGHCTPILGWLRAAQGFRQELALLMSHRELVWWDFSAPPDWAAFANTPPWLTPGAARTCARSPRFHQILRPASYRALLQRRHQLHMQYLKAPELPGGYDPVELTAGPLTLAQRHAALSEPPEAAAPPSAPRP